MLRSVDTMFLVGIVIQIDVTFDSRYTISVQYTDEHNRYLDKYQYFDLKMRGKMDREFRKQTLIRLIKKAGIVTDMVQQNLTKPKFQVLGSVGKGTTIMMPSEPIHPDGSVDIVFQIRGIAGGDVKAASAAGVNAVIVTAEAGGLGSKENLAAYGSPSFINEAVGKILSNLKTRYPDKNVHLGKLTVSSFSGGGGATAQLLMNRSQLPKGAEPPKFVFIDGLHADPGGSVMKAVVDYAKEVKNNPSAGELSIVHTAVVPTGYTSTTQVADYLLNQVGLQRQKLNGNGGPVSEAEQGGLKVIQLYDHQQPYMAKDPKTGKIRPNVPGTAGYQHIQALRWGIRNVL